MRNIIFKILFSPLSLLYGIIVGIIHFFYEVGILKASTFNIPVIGVGNLNVGGTGKTPHIEYLIRLLADYIHVATLSRGYKRKTTGFRFVTPADTAETVGDEPLQYRRKFGNVIVAVGENRAYAIPQILQSYPQIQTVLLDDAFQHRAVQAGLSILLTAYDMLYIDDYLLPSGRLREWRSGANRADIVIVTKCPPTLTIEEKNNTIEKLNLLPKQSVYFTHYRYDTPFSFYNYNYTYAWNEESTVVLLSAIANTNYLLQYIEPKVDSIIEIEFEDHHSFDKRDIEKIDRVYANIRNNNKLLITTEKDAVRLEPFKQMLYDLKIPIYILPVAVEFLFDEGSDFDEKVKSYLLDFKV